MRAGGHGGYVVQDTTDFDFDAWVRESRASQGLPPTIEDETIVTRVLILAAGLRRTP
jgi:hypothetical protein